MIFETALEYEEVVRRLKKYLGFFWSTVHLLGKDCHIYGRVNGGDFNLVLARLILARESFPVFFRGKVERIDGGCRISGRYRVPLFIKFLLVLASSLALGSLGFCYFDHSPNFHNEEVYSLVSFFCLMVFYLWVTSRGNKNYVVAFFKSELKAELKETQNV